MSICVFNLICLGVVVGVDISCNIFAIYVHMMCSFLGIGDKERGEREYYGYDETRNIHEYLQLTI